MVKGFGGIFMERPKLTIVLIILLILTLIGIVIGNQKWVASSRVKAGQYPLDPPRTERDNKDIEEENEDEEIEDDETVDEEEQPKSIAEREGIVPLDKVMYSTVSLIVRADATTDSERIGSYSPGQQVMVTGKVNNGWYRVDYMGREAYVYGVYLSDNPSR